MELRPYQTAALGALDNFLRTRQDNPCVVLPTGSGKSYVIAEAVRRWRTAYPPFRAIILAHRKELVEQNAAEYEQCAGETVGKYSAALHARDLDCAVTFASIDSVYRRAAEFKPFDVVIVDEAHRIPAAGEGKYRSFIAAAKEINPRLRVIGFTATPYRMGCGNICHKDHILNEVCYEANVYDLIKQGYLCKLRSKLSQSASPELNEVKRNHGGDYITSSLSEAVSKVVFTAVTSALGHIEDEQRKACVWFCVDVQHCEEVASIIREAGQNCRVVTGNTPVKEREAAVDDFRSGRVRHMINCNVFTEGFNAKQVDCIVLLRPTLSKGLYAQMVGRGLRLHPDKQDCLVLDYARLIDTHGPIDCLADTKTKTYVCQECEEVFSRALGKCPHCGWEIPKQTLERIEREEKEAEERERRMHEMAASNASILGSVPQTYPVDAVYIERHQKPGSPDSLRVSYRCGVSIVREWICLDHPGFAGQAARRWWAARFGRESASVMTVDMALEKTLLPRILAQKTKSITVVRDGKYNKIVGYEFAS